MQAKASPKLRMNMVLRNGPEDGSQRMLNAIEPGQRCQFIGIRRLPRCMLAAVGISVILKGSWRRLLIWWQVG